MYQAAECSDCQGAQGLIPDTQNPTAWGAASRDVVKQVETIGRYVAKDLIGALILSHVVPGGSPVVAAGCLGSAAALASAPL